MKMNRIGRGPVMAGRISLRGRGGFAIIELLLVVIVIALLSGWWFNSGSNPQQQAASQYQHSMKRSKATACLASRSAMRSVILTFTMQHPGEPVTTEALQKAGVNLNVCPEDGTITVAQDGTLQCSVHQQ